MGKYVKLHDAYLSVMESLYHAGFENESKVEIKWVDSEHLSTRTAAPTSWATRTASLCRAALGDRGIEGMIQAAQYARENHVPYFGICWACRSWSWSTPANVLGLRRRQFQRIYARGQHNVID